MQSHLAGSSLRSSPTGPQTWSTASGQAFSVRQGPNYPKYGKKAPSIEAHYECVAVDLLDAPDGRLDHISSMVQLPEVQERAKGLPLPPLFVVNVQLPLCGPSLNGKRGNGKGCSAVLGKRWHL